MAIVACAILVFDTVIPDAEAMALDSSGRHVATDVKAAFLYQFANYVEWPRARSGEAAQAPITIAIIGDDQVVAELKRILPGRKIDGRTLQVRKIESPSQLTPADILFVSQRTRPALIRLINAARDKPVLIVTEQPRALEEGAMINFVPAEGRLRFELAPINAQKQGLKFSSRLMPVALRVLEER